MKWSLLAISPFLVGFLIACSGDDGEGIDLGPTLIPTTEATRTREALPTAASATATRSNTPVPTETASSTVAGSSRMNPVPLGSNAKVGDWIIKVVSVNQNADAIVKARNQFNDPPGEGNRFSIVTLEATYSGDKEPARLLSTLSISTVGSTNLGYGFEDDCGSVPDEIDVVRDVYKGGTLSGTLCWEMKLEDVTTAVMKIQPAISASGPAVWFGIQP